MKQIRHRVILLAFVAILGSAFASIIFRGAIFDSLSWPAIAAHGLLPSNDRPTRRLAEPDAAARAQIQRNYGDLPVRFEINRGQTASQVRYLARGAGYSIFLTETEAVLQLSKGGKNGRGA